MNKNYKRILSGFMFVVGVLSVNNAFTQVDVTATGGTATATYTTVSAAFAAVNAGTHTGTISLNITGNTTEPAAPVALAASGIGSASFTSLVIKPTVTATISGSANAGSGVLNFNGSDNVTIDGSITAGGTTRDLTIQHTGAATAANTAAIRLIGQTGTGTGLGVNNFTVRNAVIMGSTPGYNNISGSTVTTSYAIYAGSNSATTMSNTAGGADYDNLTIENNEIKKAYIGVYVYAANANMSDNLIFRGNTVGASAAADAIGYKGLNAYYVQGGTVSGNTITNITSTYFVNLAAIEFGGGGDNVRISSNVIRGIANTYAYGYGAYGINIAAGNNFVIDNNSISDIYTTNYSTTSTIYNAFGIRLAGGTGHKIYYNSVHLSGNYTSTTYNVAASAALLVNGTGQTGLDIRNNIFSNVTTTNATGNVEFSAVWFPSGYNFANAVLDRNYYGIPNDASHLVGKIGTTAGTGNYLNLAAWKAVSQVNNATNDVNSFPVVNSPAPFTSNTNLMPLTNVQTAIESGAVAIAALGTPNLDITGTARPATGTAPDMGAYEFSGLPISCPQPTSISVLSAGFNNANIAWTSGGSETTWQLQYGPNGFALGTGTSVVVTDNPHDLTGLTQNSFYQVYVRAICGAGDSSLWTGPVLFNTYNQGIYIDWTSDCPPAGFYNIAATGTNLSLTDDGEAGVTLPFPILYQGTLFSNATIGNNGGVALGTTTADIPFTNATIAASTLNNVLYPFWDDMATAGAGVFHQTIGTAPNRQFIVQWNKEHISVAGNTLVYQLVIDEATNKIWFVYDDVLTGNSSYDYGASATIGAAGAQDIQVSYNSPSYLQNNSCVEIYYTDCPRPKNFVATSIGFDEIDFTWTAGASGETEWIIEYGEEGFTPGTGTFLPASTTTGNIFPLEQLTDYTIYIYANCANGDTSLALSYNFTTLPRCANPSGIGGTSDVDSLEVTWAWTENAGYAIDHFNIQYGLTGFPLYTGTIVEANGVNYADTIYDTALLASGVYQVYVQAVCDTEDTSAFIGPFTIRMPLSNDLACGAEMLPVDGTARTFNNAGATVSTNESSIAPPASGAQTTTGWANQTLNGTLWYKFTAPASGNVRVNSTAVAYDGQAAIYAVGDCGNFATFELEAANDNAIGGTSLAPNFTICGLTPMNEYYLMFDGGSATTGNFSIAISAINLEAGIANTTPLTLDVCSGETVDLFNTITDEQTGGVWSSSIPAVNASISGNMLTTAGLSYTTYNLQYRVTDGCAYDSIIGKVKVFAPSNAGTDGAITACRNQLINLYTGLGGNADLGGTWYTPAGSVNANTSYITTSNIQGNYNYTYISGNGVCPNDTAMVVVNVGSCNVLNLEEQVFAGVEVFPNPSAGMVFVTSDNNFSYEVTDANGRIVTAAQNGVKASEKNEIDLTGVERGVYFIRLNNDEAQKIYRVVIN